MKVEKIDFRNFDAFFSELVEANGNDKKVIQVRYDIEDINVTKKGGFVENTIKSFGLITSITYKILFWEKEEVIQTFIQSNKNKDFKISVKYKNGKKPGVIFIEEETLDKSFLEALLLNHFNHEMAEDPSMNIRVQLGVNYKNGIRLLDIYDDRGFYMYYWNFKNEINDD